jgi:hypothetical protein
MSGLADLLLPRRGAHYATTAHVRAAMPFQASMGLGGRGVYLGRDATGAAFCFDPFDLYERGVLTGPAMIVLGEIGRGRPTCTGSAASSDAPASCSRPSAVSTTGSPRRSRSSRSASPRAAA